MSRQLQRAWLQAYEEYTAQSESPVSYNTWCGISAISSSMKKNTYIKRWPYTIYPNQFIVLIGPPAIGKGTAINPAIDLARRAGTVNYISDRITAEKVIEVLSSGFTQAIKSPTGQLVSTMDGSATIVSTELPIFLQASEWMLPLMCEMWDKNEFSYSTKTKSSFVAKDICTSFLAGCVPEYIGKLNKDVMAPITGGFTSRCIFVYASERSKMIPWPSANGNIPKLEAELIEDLRDIATLNGEFRFTPSARMSFTNWYNMSKADQFDSEVMKGFKGRMKSHIMKVAMALSASDSNNLEINNTHMTNAIGLVDKIKGLVDVTFGGVGESQLASAQEKVLQFILHKGMATQKDIISKLRRDITLEDLGKVLHILTIAGLIKIMTVGTQDYYTEINARIAKP